MIVMTWFRVDDQLHRHPKAHEAGNAAMGLWALLGSAAADIDQGGLVPIRVALTYGTRRQLDRLVEVGLVERNGTAIKLHDWDEWQGARTDAERARSYRRRKAGAGASRDVTRDVTRGEDRRPTPSLDLHDDDDYDSVPSGEPVTKRDAVSSSSVDLAIRIAAAAIARQQAPDKTGHQGKRYAAGVERNLRAERLDEVRALVEVTGDATAAAGKLIGSPVAARNAARDLSRDPTHETSTR